MLSSIHANEKINDQHTDESLICVMHKTVAVLVGIYQPMEKGTNK